MALPIYSDVEVKGKVDVDDKLTVGNNVFTKDNLDEPIFNYAEKSIKLDKIIGKEIEITDGNTKITNNGIETIKSVLVKTGIDNKYSLIYKTFGFQSPVVFGEPGNYIEYPANDIIGPPVEFKLNNVTRYDNGDIKSLKYIALIEKYNSFRLELRLEKSSIDFILSNVGSRFTFNNYNGNSYIIEMSYVLLGKDTYQVAYEITRSAATTSQDLNALYTFSNNFSVYIEPTAIAYVYDTEFYSEYAHNHLKTNEVYAQELVSVADTVVIDGSGIKIKDKNIVEYSEEKTNIKNIHAINADSITVKDIYVPFGATGSKHICYGTKFNSFEKTDFEIISETDDISKGDKTTEGEDISERIVTFKVNGIACESSIRTFNSKLDGRLAAVSNEHTNNNNDGNYIEVPGYFKITYDKCASSDGSYTYPRYSFVMDLYNIEDTYYNQLLFINIEDWLRMLSLTQNDDSNMSFIVTVKIDDELTQGQGKDKYSCILLEEHAINAYDTNQYSSYYKKHHISTTGGTATVGSEHTKLETLYITYLYNS